MREVEVFGVRVERPTNQPIVLLKEREGSRVVPIWVGAPEAAAITFALEGVDPPRPLTHDLMLEVITALGGDLQEVRVDTLIDNVFHATLIFAEDIEVSARASDAVALALRAEAPIMVAEAIVDEVGVIVAEEDADDEVERFKEVLDQVTPEDFES